MTVSKRISILGSTGSIGRSTMDIVRRSGGRFKVAGLAAGRNIDLLREQIDMFKPEAVAVMTRQLAEELEGAPECSDTTILHGKEGYRAVASMKDADMVVSAMVGSAGLIPTLAALEAGKDVALANKESLVTAGKLITSIASEKGVSLIPVDSEHSAIFQCLQGQRREDVRRLILTASGGPFRDYDRHKLAEVTAENALNHPTWSMGAKITVDSATLMNKGLEVIEASRLFGMSVDDIDVLVHPQSIVHSMVEYIDGAVLAQMGVPDMRMAIAYALAWPKRMKLDLPPLDLVKSGPLSFEKPRPDKFPCLGLAYEAGRRGGTAPTTLNGANEVVVEAFLQGRIGFPEIPEIIRKVMEECPVEEVTDLDGVQRADALARIVAEKHVQCTGRCNSEEQPIP